MGLIGLVFVLGAAGYYAYLRYRVHVVNVPFTKLDWAFKVLLVSTTTLVGSLLLGSAFLTLVVGAAVVFNFVRWNKLDGGRTVEDLRNKVRS